MYWQESIEDTEQAIASDIIDVAFALRGRALPVDHAYALGQALRAAVPWLEQELGCGVHCIHVAGSQNGWQRPSAEDNQPLMLSRRTKLLLRVPKRRVADLIAALEQRQIDIDGAPLEIGQGKQRPLSGETTLFARQVLSAPGESEQQFLDRAARELATLGIQVRKALCGIAATLRTPDERLGVRSLLVANLSREESLRLQERGLGAGRLLGCGLFIPHKSIAPVGAAHG